MDALLLVMESSGLDRYLNSGASLLKLTEVVWLYLGFLIHVNYYCFHSLKLHRVRKVYPRSIKCLLEIVLTVTNLTKIFLSFTSIDVLINMKVLFWTWFFKITLTASISMFQLLTYLKCTQGRHITGPDPA